MKSISTFVIALLVFSFLFLSLPEKGISSVLHGCCIMDNQCVGCESGDCATTESFCTEAGSSVLDGVCINDVGGATCDFTTDWDNEVGCCVLDTNSCLEDTEWRNCISDSEPILEGEIWLPGASCRQVPQCVVRNVPTLSEWGLIAMAGILGIIGFMVIRRRKVST